MSIYYRKSTDRYLVRKYCNGKNNYIGTFLTREEAEKAEEEYIKGIVNVIRKDRDVVVESTDNEWDILFKQNKLINDTSKFKDPHWWDKESKKSLASIDAKYGVKK